MKSYASPRPLPMTRLFALGWCLLSWCHGAETENGNSKSPAATETVSRVWQVSPDFWSRDAKEEKPEAAQPDPFDGGDAGGAQLSADPARIEDYPSIVPALGPLCPRDLRPVLRKRGVTFKDGDLALYSTSTGELPVLFVRASRENVDLVNFL